MTICNSIRALCCTSAALVTLASAAAFGAVPRLNSDPSAPHTIYLDFDGHHEPKSTSYCPYPANGVLEGLPEVTVTDISGTISADHVRDIWQAVAEDFAPFNVNVTTDRAREPMAGSTNAVRIALGDIGINGALGVAPASCADPLANPPYLNTRIAKLALVQLDPRNVRPREAAKRVSHEAGHVYGLFHHHAPPTLLDDWIMAPQAPSYRAIWRDGENAEHRHQDDVAQLVWLLGRRADEAGVPPLTRLERMATTGTQLSPFHAHGTLAIEGDYDDFELTVPSVASLTFKVYAGIWTNVWSPEFGVEPNLRYRVEVLTRNGNVRIACPAQLPFTLRVRSVGTAWLGDCAQPPDLVVGSTYRVRVLRDSRDNLPGNIGRYTITAEVPPPPVPQLPPAGR